LPAWVEFMNGAVEMRPDLGGEQFDCPEGIKFIEIDSGAGLVSTVNCPLRELIAVTERTEPSLECYLHGIAPLPVSPIVEEAESEKIVTTQRPGRIEKESSGSEWKRYQLTRVEVDANGRRSLVNEMISVR
jgi:membrane carboxypeptidase/penicillin-binding protein